MKTLEKQVIVFNSLKEILASTDHQVNAQELLNGRMYLNISGWTDVELSPILKTSIALEVSELLGGRSDTKRAVMRALLHRRPQHWGLERILLSKYGILSYCAGQDYVWETGKIRAYLKNL